MVKIVTDSSAHLSDELLARYDIRVVPLKLIFGDRVYREGLDITNDEFYPMLRQAKELPTTSQPSSGEFLEVYSELVGQGHEIVSIHISSELSGTVASAQAAKEQLPEARIAVMDSRSVSLGLGMIVLEAARAADEGKSYEEVVALVREMIPRVKVVFVVDTLEYLHKGGRIGGAATLLGTLLNIKPILRLEDGRIEPLSKARTKKKALAKLLDAIGDYIGSGDAPVLMAVAHAQAEEEARWVEEQARSRFNCREVHFVEIGPVIGVHAGPGVVGICACVPGPCAA